MLLENSEESGKNYTTKMNNYLSIESKCSRLLESIRSQKDSISSIVSGSTMFLDDFIKLRQEDLILKYNEYESVNRENAPIIEDLFKIEDELIAKNDELSKKVDFLNMNINHANSNIEAQKEIISRIPEEMENLVKISSKEEEINNEAKVNNLKAKNPNQIKKSLEDLIVLYKDISQVHFEKVSDNEMKIEVNNICSKDSTVKLILNLVVEDKFYVKKCFPEKVQYNKYNDLLSNNDLTYFLIKVIKEGIKTLN